MMPEATVVCFYDSMPSLCSHETNDFLCFNICKEKGVQKSVFVIFWNLFLYTVKTCPCGRLCKAVTCIKRSFLVL